MHVKSTNEPKTFNETFLTIKSKSIKDAQQNIETDEFDSEKPTTQNYLTNINSIIQNQIDFSTYFQVDFKQINTRDINNLFRGILLFIYENSENKFNINEIEFHFSDARNRERLSKIKRRTNLNHFDILNIFDYLNPKSQFQINNVENAFFGVKFHNIDVCPIAYSIRSGEGFHSKLVSFVFEAFDDFQKRWIVLDERVNTNDLNYDGAFMLFFVRTTDKFYSSFRIKQIDCSINKNWGFSLAAFEIHGIIKYKNGNYTTQTYIGTDFYDPLDDLSNRII